MSGDDLTSYKHDVQKVHFNFTILAHLCIWDLEEWRCRRVAQFQHQQSASPLPPAESSSLFLFPGHHHPPETEHV